jgi:flagellar protein FliS
MQTSGVNDAVQQYQQIGVRNTVAESTPHRLIQLLMEHALTKINFARGFIERKEVAAKGKAIGEAIDVVGGLQASLNHSTNNRMSENFDALYAYMMRRLLQANIDDDIRILDEVVGLLGELKEAWDVIADDPAVVAQHNSSD